MKKRIKNKIIVVLILIVLGLTYTCIQQYKDLMRERILNLNHAFYYMQEIIQEESELGFENWAVKCETLKKYHGRTTEGTVQMGDYAEISDLILTVSNIDDPKTQEAFLSDVARKKVRWTVEKWRWSADWKNNND